MLKLKRFSEGVWFEWPEDKTVRLKIRPLTPKVFLDLREKARHGKVAVSKPDGTVDIVDDYTESVFNWEIFKHMLEDWEGISIEGQKTKEDGQEAIFDCKEVRDFIFEKSRELGNIESVKFEGELKNSESSQSG